MKKSYAYYFALLLFATCFSNHAFSQTQPVKYKLLINEVACSNFDLVKNHPEDVTRIEIELRNGTPFPKEIFAFTSLKKLVIRDLEGEFLTGNFAVFTQMEELIIEDCDDLLTLPESMGSIKTLKLVEVLENFSLVNIPESFYDLPLLQRLTFSISSDRVSENIGKLTNLQELGIEFHKKKNDNNIYFPEEIIQLTRLKTVELAAMGFPNKNTSVSINNIVASAQAKAFLKTLLK